MADILPYLGVERVFSPEDAASQKVVVEDFSGLTKSEAETILKEHSLSAEFVGTGETVTGQIPEKGATVPGGSQMILYLGEEVPEQTVKVPDFTGMHRQQAADEAGKLGLYILAAGNDEISPQVVVTSQSIQKGEQVPRGTTITLNFVDTKAKD